MITVLWLCMNYSVIMPETIYNNSGWGKAETSMTKEGTAL